MSPKSHHNCLWQNHWPCVIVSSTLQAGLVRLKDEVPSAGLRDILYNSTEIDGVIITPESRWSWNWILHLSCIVLKQRLMPSVFMMREEETIDWRTLFISDRLRNSRSKWTSVWKMHCFSGICLLAFFLRLIAISFLENLPLFAKGSSWSLDVVKGLSDIWFLWTLSFSETVLSFRRTCMSLVSTVSKKRENKS